MEHIFNINPEPFEMMKCGQKTIELRLYDEKRRSVKVGDTIKFIHTGDNELVIFAKVKALHIFSCFKELYSSLPLLKCGYTEENVNNADASDMDIYYSKERQSQYGVVGIEIAVIGNN